MIDIDLIARALAALGRSATPVIDPQHGKPVVLQAYRAAGFTPD